MTAPHGLMAVLNPLGLTEAVPTLPGLTAAQFPEHSSQFQAPGESWEHHWAAGTH